MRDCLLEVKAEVGNIIYAVGDYGRDIKKGLELAEIKPVHDIKAEARSLVRVGNGADR